MSKIFKTLRTHWKKSLFAGCALSYCFNFAHSEYQKNNLLREYARKAVKFGDVSISVLQSPRHVVVILNPACNKQKSLKEYQKFCAPLLHLAGTCVSVLTTKDESDAINLVDKIPTNADALLIAGGDGTVSEVITGLLRCKNEGKLNKLLPIGILPLGKTNSLAKQLYCQQISETDKLFKFYLLMEATSSVINEVTRNISAMEIRNLELEELHSKIKPIYAVNHIRMGVFRDADAQIDKYWYFGPLRSYASYIFGSYDRDRPIEVNVEYNPPCGGCAKCYVDRIDLKPAVDLPMPRRWWHAFVPKQNSSDSETTTKNFEKVENLFCDQKRETSISTIELNIVEKVVSGIPLLRLDIGPRRIDYLDFVKTCWSRKRGLSSYEDDSVQKIDAQNILLSTNYPNTQKKLWITMDSEDYEFSKIKVKLLHNILPVYVPAIVDNQS